MKNPFLLLDTIHGKVIINVMQITKIAKHNTEPSLSIIFFADGKAEIVIKKTIPQMEAILNEFCFKS